MSKKNNVIPFGDPARHYFSRAFSKFGSGDYPETLVLLRKAVQADPLNAEYRLNYAVALHQTDQYLESVTAIIEMFKY